ncbi:MAG: thioredoxin domain-containing protein [Planctomycetes bacterium]|nr:thioredoxin domain-containing protein [Planctomycetota bacterium]
MTPESRPTVRQPRQPNRLIHETSPYLQQHARNPVDWYPWGPDAHAAAKSQDKPIFLSIGYSACHWCHVMEHESFENASIAAFLNSHFISIKVDREERPDIDQVYMNAVQLMTGRGGWPMSVFLTPDLLPFFGGTYWPPVSNRGLPGFIDILQQIHDAWLSRRKLIWNSAEELTAAVRDHARREQPRTILQESHLERAGDALLSLADRHHGGFGSAPKFPHAHDLRVLLRCWKRFGNADALEFVKLTLDRMAGGGIYDQLGGGFHRYSTDERWLVPHFEKMLYDNALLVPAYLEACQATGQPGYARVARETLDYVLQEMTHPEGGFYSTQDADSEGVEGKFFVWTANEIVQLLGPADARIFNACYDVTAAGNWEGQTILNQPHPAHELARTLGISEPELAAVLARCRTTLKAARACRVAPGRDDKILVNWNGMMISAMAQGAQVLGEPRYARAAQQAADFLLQTMSPAPGTLWHCWKDGQARFSGYLDDYAHLIDGLIDLYQVVFDPQYLTAACRLAETLISQFHDTEHQGFFYTARDAEVLVARNKEVHDGSTPSGNSIAAWALLRLGRITGRPDFEQYAQTTLEFLSGVIDQSPTAAGLALLALDFQRGPTRELALVDGTDATETAAVLAALHLRFEPNKIIVRKFAGSADSDLPEVLMPLLKGKTARSGQATIYLCDHGTCGLPVVGVDGLEAALAPAQQTIKIPGLRI